MVGALVAIALVAALVSALMTKPGNGERLTIKGGGAAKEFHLPNIRDGQPDIDLAQFRGRPVVVNFWASWCVPCRKEMPAFQAVYVRVKSRVVFLGVNHQDSRRLGLELLDDSGVTYPSGYDPSGAVAASFGLFGMPTTIFVSPQGKILERRTGAFTASELQSAIDRLFGG